MSESTNKAKIKNKSDKSSNKTRNTKIGKSILNDNKNAIQLNVMNDHTVQTTNNTIHFTHENNNNIVNIDKPKKNGRPEKYENIEDLEKKINEYFKWCDETKEHYTILSMCVYLDITRQTMSRWLDNEKFSDAIKKARQRIEKYGEQLLINSKNPAGIIFWLKNTFGWQDKQEIVNTNTNLELTTDDLDDIKREERIKELMRKLDA